MIYAAIAAISDSVIAYQLAATASAALTGFLLARMLKDHVGQWAQIGVAILYFSLLPWLGGHGGQAPVFYNLLMAIAAYLILRAIPDLENGKIGKRIFGAIAISGIALVIKQTIVVEAAYFGLFAVIVAYRNGLTVLAAAKYLALFALIGVTPFVASGVLYASLGHWSEFSRAMFASNFVKGSLPAGIRLNGARVMALPLLFPLALASAGLAAHPRSLFVTFLFGWLCASAAALLIVPNFYWHYALPILLPICVAAGLGFHRWPISIPLLSGFGLAGLWVWGSFDVAAHRLSVAQFKGLVVDIRQHAPRRTLLVYDGPVYAFAAANVQPLSRVVFPNHFSERIESGATGRSAEEELRTVLARKPSAVLFQPKGGYFGDNPTTRKMTEGYVLSNCKFINRHVSFETGVPRLTNLYGDCK